MNFQAAKAYLEYRNYTLGSTGEGYWNVANPRGTSDVLSTSEVISRAQLLMKASKITERSRLEEPVEEEDAYVLWDA